jgi:hypothetical protein
VGDKLPDNSFESEAQKRHQETVPASIQGKERQRQQPSKCFHLAFFHQSEFSMESRPTLFHTQPNVC